MVPGGVFGRPGVRRSGPGRRHFRTAALALAVLATAAGLSVQCAGSAYAQVDTTPPEITSAEYSSPILTITFSEDIAADPDYTKMHIRDAGQSSGGITLGDIDTKSLSGDTITATLDRAQHAEIILMASPRILIGGGAVFDPSHNPLSGAFDITTASFTAGNHHDVSAQASYSTGLAFSANGARMFVVGQDSDKVHQYELSTPWDISTASYGDASHDVSSQEATPNGLAFSPDGQNMFVVGDTSDSIHQYTLSTSWDISTASYTAGDSYSVASQETTPHGLAFSPDGQNMFVAGTGSDSIHQYTLSTPWDISTASYTAGDSYSVASQETAPTGVAFSPDGQNMFVTGWVHDRVRQYALSTPWNIATASYTGNSLNIYDQEEDSEGLAFSPDGANMFVVGSFGTIHQYDLNAAFPITVDDDTPPTFDSATYSTGDDTLTITFSEPLNATIHYGLLHIRDDGESSGGVSLNGVSSQYHSSDALTVVLTQTQRDEVDAMTTPQLDIEQNAVFDEAGNGIAAAPDQVITVNDTIPPRIVSAEYSSPILTITFSEDIAADINYTKMHIRDAGESSGGITLDDITTKSLDGDTITATLDRAQHAEIILMSSPRIIIEGGAVFDPSHNPLSEAFDITAASFTAGNHHNVSPQDILPADLAFSADGTRMFVVGNDNKRVYQYSLSTPWDIATTSFTTGDSYSIASQETSPEGLAFSPDGQSMFVVGWSSDSVYQYELSTPWDITTASYSDASYSISSQETRPNGLAFSPDGQNMFVAGTDSDSVHQYELSTPWDISTASYTDGDSYSIASQETNPQGIAFSPDGQNMFVVGFDSDKVHQYELSTPWDITTASHTGDSHDVTSQETDPTGVAFSPDGTRMFMLGLEVSVVYQYDLGAAFPITVDDDTPPIFDSATYSTGNGTLTITFSEPLNATIHYGLLHIRDAGQSSGGVSLGDASYKTHLSYTVTAVLTSAQQDDLAAMTTPQLDIEQNAVFDEAGNGIAAAPDQMITVNDTTPPEITSAEYSSPILTITFSEDIATDTDYTKMHIRDAGQSSGGITLGDIDTKSLSGDTITATLSGAQHAEIILMSSPRIIIEGGAVFDPSHNPLSTPWDITIASYTGDSFSVSNREPFPTGLAFSPDGANMFAVGSQSDNVHQYELSTPWDITTASHDASYSISSQETSPNGLAFSPDGARMFVVGSDSDKVHQYTLSTPWDITTASYDDASHDVSSQEDYPIGLAFSPDGANMFVVGDTNAHVYQYDLSTPWDISTASYTDASHDVIPQETAPTGLAFSPDGANMFTVGSQSDNVHQYELSTPWDITTASHDASYSISSQETSPNGLAFSPDGARMFVMGSSSDRVYQYGLGAAFPVTVSGDATPPEITSAEYTHSTLALTITFSEDIAADINYTKMHIRDAGQSSGGITLGDVDTKSLSGDTITATLSRAQHAEIILMSSPRIIIEGGAVFDPSYNPLAGFDITTASYTGGSHDVSSQTDSPLDVTFSPDGTRMFVMALTATGIYQYDLSTPWDVTTASFTSGDYHDVHPQDALPYSVAFSADGRNMYVLGTFYNDVTQYDLSTPWDVTTASYTDGDYHDINSQDAGTVDIAFSADGRNMFVLGAQNDRVYQYALSTPWDVTTASYTGDSHSVASQETVPSGLAFSPDGARMFVVGTGSDAVHQYVLSTPWDITTASHNDASHDVASQEDTPSGLAFSPDGTRMFVMGYDSTSVYQYDLNAAFPITIHDDVLPTFDSATYSTGDGTLVMTFSEPLNATIHYGLLHIRDAGESSGGIPLGDVSSKTHLSDTVTAVLTSAQQDELAAMTTPQLDIEQNAVFDEAGNGIAAAPDLIITVNDTTLPRIVSAGYYHSTLALTITFSEDIAADTDYAKMHIRDAGQTSGGITLDDIDTKSLDGDTITATLDRDQHAHISGMGSPRIIIGEGAVFDLSHNPLSGAFDITPTSVAYGGAFGGGHADNRPTDLAFSTDGQSMFVAGSDSDKVHQYTLSTPWDITTASYTGDSHSISAQESNPEGLAFSPDGQNMFVTGFGSDRVHQYELSTPWDVSTASYTTGDSYRVASQETSPEGVAFSPDGRMMFVTGYDSGSVHQYELSTPWNVTTASYNDQSYDVSSQDSPSGLAFSPDGTKMFVVGYTSHKVHQYSLAAPWDITTASYDDQSYDISSQPGLALGLAFSPDGARMFVVTAVDGLSISQYDLTPAFPITIHDDVLPAFDSATYSTGSGTLTITFSEPLNATIHYGLIHVRDTGESSGGVSLNGVSSQYHSSDALTVVLTQTQRDEVDAMTTPQLDIEQNAVFDEAGNGIAAAPDLIITVNDTTLPRIVSAGYYHSTLTLTLTFSEDIAADTDYTKMHIRDAGRTSGGITLDTISTKSLSGDTITATLSRAQHAEIILMSSPRIIIGGGAVFDPSHNPLSGFDVATASFTVGDLHDVSSQETSPEGLAFSPDGGNMFVVGPDSDAVHRYSLSTPWDITTVSYTTGNYHNVTSQEIAPYDLAFSPDGRKMFVVGFSNKEVYQYDLATPWDISTASYGDASYSVSAQENLPEGLAFSPDGTNMFVVGWTSDSVYQYALSTPWDITTASYTGNSLDIQDQEEDPEGLAFSPDGRIMFVAGSNNDAVHRYSLSTPWDITTASHAASESFVILDVYGYPLNVYFSPDGANMFVTGVFSVSVIQFELDAAFPVTVNDDVLPAFDSATYSTGNGTLVMTFSENIAADTDYTKMHIRDAGESSGGISLGDASSKTHLSDTVTVVLTQTQRDEVDAMTTPQLDIEQDAVFDEAGNGIAAAPDQIITVNDITPPEITSAEYDSPILTITFSEDIAADTDYTKMHIRDAGRTSGGITLGDIDTKSLDGDTITATLSRAQHAEIILMSSPRIIIGGGAVFDPSYNPLPGFDITTASHTDGDSHDVSSQTNSPLDVTFSPDGTRMFVMALTDTGIYQYDLSTPWDVTTASFTSGDYHDVHPQDALPYSVAFSADGRNMYVLGTFYNDVTQYDLSTPWDVTTASYTDGDYHDVNSQDTGTVDIAFSADGRNMFVLGAQNDRVYQYSLSTPWDVTTASYTNGDSHDVSSQETVPTGVAFSTDGTNMFVVGTGSDAVHQYVLSTPWDITTASHTGDSHDVTSQETDPTGLAFSPDGARMFVVGYDSTSVYQYDLDAAFPITIHDDTPPTFDSATYSTGDGTLVMTFSEPLNATIHYGLLHIRDAGESSDGIPLDGAQAKSAASDTVTAVLTSAQRDELAAMTTPQLDIEQDAVFDMSGNGVAAAPDLIITVNDTTPPEITSAGYSSPTLTITFSEDIAADTDYAKMHIRDAGQTSGGITLGDVDTKSLDGDTITATLSGAQHIEISGMSSPRIIIGGGAVFDPSHNPLSGAFDIATASYDNDWYRISSQDILPTDLEFSADGTKMFVMEQDSTSVYQYALSTPWDITTASSDDQSYDVSAQETGGGGTAFSPDGRNMFVVGTVSDKVHRYALSTSWDVTTASYTDGDSHSVTSQEAVPLDVAFSPDGRNMFVVGAASDMVHRYALSTPWDITTASYTTGDSYSVSAQAGLPSALAFSPDGRNMFVVGSGSANVIQYELSTPWDITTASFTAGNSYSIFPLDTSTNGAALSPDGTRMFMLGSDDSVVYQYELGAAFPITIHDDTPPAFSSATYSTGYGTLTIIFSEPLNATIHYGLLHIRDAGESSGGVSLNGASSQYHSSDTVTAVLTSAQQDELAAMTTPQLDIEQNAVFDMSGNGIAAAPDQMITVNDTTTPPAFSSATYSTGYGTLTIIFSEPLNATIHYGLIHIRDDGESSGGISLRDASSKTHLSDTVTTVLTSAQQDELAAMSMPQLDIEQDAVFDMSGNGIAATPNQNITVYDDTTPPTLSSAVFTTGDTTLTITFSEPLNATIHYGLLHIRDTGESSGGIPLDGAQAKSAASDTVTTVLTSAQQDELAAMTTPQLDIEQNAVFDEAGNGIAAAPDQMITVNDTTTPPAFSSATYSTGYGTLTIIFSEPLNATIHYGLLHIRDAGESSGGISLRDASSKTHLSDTVTTVLTSAQQDELAAMSMPQLDIEQDAVFDMSGNGIAATPNQNITVYDDTTPPAFSSATYLTGNGILTITFSEPLNATIHYGLLHIRDTGESSGGIPLGDASSKTHLSDTVTTVLTSAQQDELADMTTPQLDIEQNAVFDMSGNGIATAPNQAITVYGDTPPDLKKDIEQPVGTDTPSETAPTVSLRGGPSVYLSLGAAYTEDPICYDPQDGIITNISRSGSVDTRTPGTYTVTYTCTDSDGLSGSATQLVRVFSATIKVVRNSPDLIVLNVGDSYTDPGARCVSSDGSSTAAAIYSNKVDTSRPGLYAVSYRCYDTSGVLQDSSVRWVEVVKRTVDLDPVIVPPAPVTIIAGQPWVDPGIICTDDRDPNPKIQVDLYELDTSTPGVYTVYYVCTDDAGNVATSGRKVTVEAP